MTKKKLSTSLTFIFKVLLPSCCIVLLSIVAGTHVGESLLIAIGVVLAAIGLGVIFYHTISAVKIVKIDSDNLYVSNYLTEAIIPLENIRNVDEIIILSPRVITVHFYDQTKFGSKVVFFGSYEPFLFFTTHPAVTTIKKAKEQKLSLGL